MPISRVGELPVQPVPDVPLALRPGLVTCLSPWRPLVVALTANTPRQLLVMNPRRIAWFLAVPPGTVNVRTYIAPESSVGSQGIPIDITQTFAVTSDSWFSLVTAEWWIQCDTTLTVRVYELVRPA